MTRDTITPEMVREFLRYDTQTGRLYWRKRDVTWFPSEGHASRWNGKNAGKEAFTSNNGGYRDCAILRVGFLAHRVAWAIATGEWPQHTIDHINGDKLDNRLANLRDVPHAVNCKNTPLRINSASGNLGVNQFRGKWRAYISIDGRPKHLGLFDSKEDAIVARQRAEIENGYHENHARLRGG